MAILTSRWPTAQRVKSAIDPILFYGYELSNMPKPRKTYGLVNGGLCPFHEDKRPGSFYINLSNGSFHCFSCGVSGGDIIAFSMRRHKLSFREALEKLTGRSQLFSPEPKLKKNIRHVDKNEADCRNAARRAMTIWNRATADPSSHPYPIKKSIQPYGARLLNSTLVLPIQSFDGKLTSIQFIDRNGRKRLLKGGRKRDCFIPISPHILSTGYAQNYSGLDNSAHYADFAYNCPRIVICEGWATGCSLAEDDPDALVIAAVDAGNLEPVSVAARRLFPTAKLIIAGDDDRLKPDNPGVTKSTAAAIASNALLALPQWPEDAPKTLSDFNDLAVWLAGGAS